MKLTFPIAAAFALILSASLARAQSELSLQWEPNAPAERVEGYKVWLKVTTPAPATPEGTPAPPVESWKLIGQTAGDVTRFTIQKVPAGTSVYAVSAFNSIRESERSDELSDTPIQAPKGLSIVITVRVNP